MKVATAVMNFHKRGGVERAAVELSTQLARRGHEVTIYSSAFEPPDAHLFRYVHVPSLSWKTSTAMVSYRLASAAFLPRAGVALIHAHGVEPGRRDVVTAQSCHRAGVDIRRSYTQHVQRSANLHIADTLRLRYEAQTFAPGYYKKIIAVSQGVKRELCEYYGTPADDIAVIPNGYNETEFYPATSNEKTPLRRSLNLQDESIVLLFVANEFERKGLSVLLEALALVKSKDITLLVAGRDDPASYRGYAEKLGIGNQVHFAGLQSELGKYYRASDIFILPTFYEAFALATIEAAASGLPLLVTKVNGTEELVTDGVNGYFIERNPDDIAVKIKLLVEDAQHRMSLGTNASRTAELYTWEKITGRTLQVYEGIL